MEFLLGTILGAILGVVADRVWSRVVAHQDSRRHLATNNAINREHEKLKEFFRGMHLVQRGWQRDGFFAPGTIAIRVNGKYEAPELVRTLATSHEEAWSARGATNNEQIGLRGFRVDRLSDDPSAERSGQAHQLLLDGHSYDYFDFLATHRLLSEGANDERGALVPLAADANIHGPSRHFPTPLSVGLSVVAEHGGLLVLPRRARNQSHAGSWASGLVFNAVGEGCAPRDLAAAGQHADSLNPEVTAIRGLYEEMGLHALDIASMRVRLHSFVFDSQLLDFKFFGTAETPLPASELRLRWESAPDRAEASEIEFLSIRTRSDCKNLLSTIIREREQWSDEAAFCTIHTLLCLEKLRLADVLEALKSHS